MNAQRAERCIQHTSNVQIRAAHRDQEAVNEDNYEQIQLVTARCPGPYMKQVTFMSLLLCLAFGSLVAFFVTYAFITAGTWALEFRVSTWVTAFECLASRAMACKAHGPWPVN